MKSPSILEFRTLLPALKKYRTHYFWGLVCLLVVDLAQMVIPQFIKRAIDLISSGAAARTSLLLLAAAMIGSAALISSGRFLWRFFIHGASRRIETELRDRLFAHLMRLSFDFYQGNKIGDLMARATNDMNAVRMAIGMGFVAFIDGTVMAAAILVIIFIEDGRTAALAVLPLPFITVLILAFGRAVGQRFKRAQEAYSALSETVQETFAGIRVIKSFVKGSWFVKKFADTNDDYRKANMELVKIFGLFFPLISFLSGITTLILLLAGGSRVIEGRMSAGTLVAMFSYLQMLIWPMVGTGFMINMMQRGAASLGRINEILAVEPLISSPAGALEAPLTASPYAVELRDLHFAYPNGTLALRGVDLRLPRGSILGLLGRTGSGKTTLLKTLSRMLDPPPGTVFIDGMDVRDWDLGALRSRFGVTPQDTYLFSASIKNNIAFGVPEAEEPRLEAVAELSAIAQDLGDFKEGWDTVIGERGLTLSGGQKQRVAISRAVLRDPEILLLDDALSAVDAQTEKRILERLLAERRGRTTILVSHRVSTLANADLVIVLDSGGISEIGTPRELAEGTGFYAQMARLQRLEQTPAQGTT